MSNILKYQNPSSPLLNPHKIIENIPAREWGPRKINEDGTITEGEGTSFLRAPFQYWGNKGLGLQNEKLARDLVSDFTWMMIKNPNYNPILDKNYQSYDDAVNYLNHLEGLKKYLGLPYDTGLLMESKYKPTRLQGTNEKTYKFKSSTAPGYWDDVVDDMVIGEYNKNQYYDQSLNEFTAYRDRDKKGDFVSIYDEWDYNPAVRGGNKKLNKVVDSVTGGKPFVIYDRIYLDDHYDVPEEARGNPFITPAVVTAHKKGGRIHIKKKNRGKFTEYCGGKVTEECIAKGKKSKDPKIRKRATFAANARKWKHEDGGILKAQNSVKLPGYVQYNGSDLSDIETFNKNWLNHRDFQLAHQGLKDENIKNKLNWLQRNFGTSDKTVANLVREQLFSNLDNTKELSFSDALKDSQGRYLLTESMYVDFPGERKLYEVEVGPPKPVEDWKLDYSFNGSVGGTHYPDFNTIIYNDSYQNTPVKIHERDHAMFGQYHDKNIGLKIVDNIFKHEFLDDDVVDKWGYYDEPGEIRARLMKMRYDNRLDPNHKYTFDEIENMRNDPTFIDEHIFDRYTNKYIEYLLNDVAQNTINKNRLDYRSLINFAKNGGILKAQGGTGNGFWSKLWNAVKEGGMAARDAKLGAVGAQQVRDLYSEGKNQEAQDLAKQYAKANTTGIALAGGAASTGLLGDLMVTGATTAADTFIDGDTENFGSNLVKNAAGDLIGHGAFGALKNVNFGDILAKIKHPTWKKYYHGSPEEFDIKNFYKGTVADSGLHMSDRKEVAEYFAGANWFNAQKPTVYEFYAPKPTMEFMDLHGNGVNMLSGNTKRISGNALGKGTFDGTPYSQLEYKALRENGGEDVIDFLTPYTNDRYGSIVQPFQLKRDVTIPIEKYHWPNRPKYVDDRLKEMRRQYDLAIESGDDATRVKLNSEVSDIMAENGIPVVKYANNNAFEGGGMSYMLFDRSKLHLINPDHQFDIMRPTVTTIGTGLGAGYGVSQVKDE